MSEPELLYLLIMPTIQENYNMLKKFCQASGADLFGVADIRSIKEEIRISPLILKKIDRAVSIGVRISPLILEEIQTHPTKLYFHHYRTVNTFLDQLALRLSSFIIKKGYLSIPIPASQIIDWQKQTAHLSHKRIGFLAGLGWQGRNNLLVNPKLGSQFRLVTVLTNMDLKADKPLKENCATCRICIEVCLVNAIKESPSDFDHIRCFEKLKDFQRQKLADQYICGICVKACKGKKG